MLDEIAYHQEVGKDLSKINSLELLPILHCHFDGNKMREPFDGRLDQASSSYPFSFHSGFWD